MFSPRSVLLGLVTSCFLHSPSIAAQRTQVPHGLSGNQINTDGVFDGGAAPADGNFYFHDVGHRCVDFGARDSWRAGSPVYIYSCNGTIAQQVRVKEIDGSHDVELRVQALFCMGVKGGQVAPGAPLELQACNNSPSQRFALDGDTILMGAQLEGRVSREFAIEPEHKRTPNRTPLVVAPRELSDAEYFRYEAVDHSALKPTNGFFVVSTEAALAWALGLDWGTVIEVDDKVPLVLTKPQQPLHEGVTLRGYRKYTYQGPEIRTCLAEEGGHALDINQPTTRITGLRLRGQMSDPACTGNLGNDSTAIRVDADSFGSRPSWIDRLDIGYWHGHAIDIHGPVKDIEDCSPDLVQFPRDNSLKAVGNFVHHNNNYGIVTGEGAFSLVKGNIFYRQGAHSIAADPKHLTGYAAFDNLILQDTRVHDIDMHGSLHPGHWYGGIAGDYFDVGWNTVLPDSHMNLDLRGTPCRFAAVHDSVFRQSKGDAVHSQSTKPIVYWDNQWNASPHPMSSLAVGDFDGDKLEDVFVGTGAAWYFSSGGQAEWRFLNRMPEHASQLRFGDFDGDGRTDVIALHGALIDVSWGGVSPWQTINVTAWPIENIAVGDFDGDHVSDLFLATGKEWFYAPGGKNWAPFGTSKIPVSGLRFGDFTHEGHTEVLRVSSNHKWQLVRGIGAAWETLGSSRDAELATLVVGDFNGDGFADVARAKSGRWEFTSPAQGPGWVFLRNTQGQIITQPVGRFNDDAKSDVILWNGRQFDFAPGAKNPVGRLSRQDMK